MPIPGLALTPLAPVDLSALSVDEDTGQAPVETTIVGVSPDPFDLGAAELADSTTFVANTALTRPRAASVEVPVIAVSGLELSVHSQTVRVERAQPRDLVDAVA